MAFDWRDFLLLAHDLRHATQESRQRTAIGRAYYYVYNVANTEAQRLGYNPNPKVKTAGVHKRLWDWCLSHPNTDIKALGDSGNTLHARRIDVDYKASRPVLPQHVQKQLDEAVECEMLLAKITLTAPPPPLP